MEAKDTELTRFSTEMDPGKPEDLMKFQKMVSEWSMVMGLQSATIKSVRDALQGIIQKM
ncbi:EscF/YscF/HrpA family type III secretion system needle major subunit [Photobacterium chitinilyticum]|nr:EscF/YscF/HrpA family type III secretion system needle major subunit [Photobacterium chitinilyticum]